MLRPLGFALVFGLFSGVCGPAGAQGRPPESSVERYTFQQTERGMLRLDSRTGQVSLCGSASAGLTCRVIPDERAVLEAEIARLETENAALKKTLADRGVVVSPPPIPPASIPDVADKSPGPDDKTQPDRARPDQDRHRHGMATSRRDDVADERCAAKRAMTTLIRLRRFAAGHCNNGRANNTLKARRGCNRGRNLGERGDA